MSANKRALSQMEKAAFIWMSLDSPLVVKHGDHTYISGPSLFFPISPLRLSINTAARIGASHAVYLALLILHHGLKDHFKGLQILTVLLFFHSTLFWKMEI